MLFNIVYVSGGVGSMITPVIGICNYDGAICVPILTSTEMETIDIDIGGE